MSSGMPGPSSVTETRDKCAVDAGCDLDTGPGIAHSIFEHVAEQFGQVFGIDARREVLRNVDAPVHQPTLGRAFQHADNAKDRRAEYTQADGPAGHPCTCELVVDMPAHERRERLNVIREGRLALLPQPVDIPGHRLQWRP
ncbi:MAG: hypothetical protein KL863_19875 [Rhizobium sp.]|nr:hypothetical protein [Rhizobium sp.]